MQASQHDAPAANVLSVDVRHGNVPTLSPSDTRRLDVIGCDAVVNDTTFAEGCTYSVSIPSAAPISTDAALAGLVCSLVGTVTDLLYATRVRVLGGAMVACELAMLNGTLLDLLRSARLLTMRRRLRERTRP